MKAIAGLVAIFVTLPIWFVLVYRILAAINASELTWFLFWVYVPATLFVHVVAKLAADD